jgi:hypothetical protein
VYISYDCRCGHGDGDHGQHIDRACRRGGCECLKFRANFDTASDTVPQHPPHGAVEDKGEPGTPERDLRVIASRVRAALNGNSGYLTSWCVSRLAEIADSIAPHSRPSAHQQDGIENRNFPLPEDDFSNTGIPATAMREDPSLKEGRETVTDVDLSAPVKWYPEFLHPDVDLCVLCGNSGRFDTRGRAISGAGVDAGVVGNCICPNGRQLQLQLLSSGRRARHDG